MAFQVVLQDSYGEAGTSVKGETGYDPAVGCRGGVDHRSLELKAHPFEDDEKIEYVPLVEGQVGDDPDAS